MKVEKVFISTYKYDFHFAKVCIASIRYWYPEIPIFLIKDEKDGSFDTSQAESKWNVQVASLPRKKFGWGYGKLEVLFKEDSERFFVIDADAVITGPVFELAAHTDADFVVDKEEQPVKRFNEIYYNLDMIHKLDDEVKYPGYSFNTGQWFGTSGIIKRDDFNKTLHWSEPPVTRNKNIIVNNDQGHLNYIIHLFEQQAKVKVSRVRMLVWPVNENADFIELQKIIAKAADQIHVIHWAGMSAVQFEDLPRQDILQFYKNYYYSRLGPTQKFIDRARSSFLRIERKVSNFIRRTL